METATYEKKFRLDSTKLKSNMLSLAPKVKTAVLMYAGTKAPVLESYMKTHRKWTDRSGMAKTLLNAKVSKPDENTVRFTLSHGVDYGIWLELAHEKKYAIIEPTINLEGPKILNDLNLLLDKVSI